MRDVRQIIADNLIELRKVNKLTQLELAEKLNYSDKAISKWERGESLPDVEILCQKHHLMIGSVLEQINDFSYDKVEDAVIEDDGDTIYVMTDYKDKLI
jgi:transcriptional regulator with XRE-family HTH domain